MHASAMKNGRLFFETYVHDTEDMTALDIGSQNINGSLRDVCPKGIKYVGVDMEVGDGVDVVQQDPYILPFDDESFRVVVSSSCFEHSEMFWLLYLEVMRVLPPTGLFWLNAPSTCPYHRFPVDCWRFYPDGGTALINWGRRHGLRSAVLESYIGVQSPDVIDVSLTDFVCIFVKDERCASQYRNRILHSFRDFTHGFIRENDGQLKAISPAA